MSFRNAAKRVVTSNPTQRVAAISSQLSRPIRTMASVPSTMKGVIIEKTGGPEVLSYKTDLPVPEPKGIVKSPTSFGENANDHQTARFLSRTTSSA